MTRYRIKAYFMHEHEQAAAQQAVAVGVITEAEWTPGYLIGVVDDSSLPALSKQGLVVSLIEEVAPVEDPLAPRVFSLNMNVARSTDPRTPLPLPVAIENQDPQSKIQSRARQTQYYVVRFNGPITQARQKELRQLDIRLLERLSRNKYTVQLKPSQVNRLAELPYVDWLRLYTAEDTLRTEPAASPPPAADPADGMITFGMPAAAQPASSARTCLYTVRLHQKKDTPAIVKWLAAQKVKPIWKRGDQLQVALLENSRLLAALAERREVATIDQVEAPKLFDGPARALLGLVRNDVRLGLEGAGEIIGVADTGIDATHPDLAHRIAGVSAWGRKGDTSDPEGHGTHVAGCAVGDGTASNGEVMGAAPKAKLFFQSILDAGGGLGGLPPDLGDLLKEAHAHGARIHNNSWGAFTFARYTHTSLDIDRFVTANPDMLVIIAAGNDGIGIPRAAGSVMNAADGWVDWPSVAAPATAKNGLTVGASRSSRTAGGYSGLTWGEAWPDRYPHRPIARERISSDDQRLAAFSSRGPSDLMIKPDVVAPGTDIAAAKSKDAPLYKYWGAYPGNPQYGFMGGTSMAAPYVAGCAALVREWYRKRGKWATPSAALLKATLINGTQRITGADAIADKPGDPNFHQGFGRIDMACTVPNPITPNLKLVFADTWKNKKRAFSSNERFLYRVKVGPGLPLRICLAWTDPGARSVQNSLELIVDDAHGKKWVGNAQAATLLNVAGGPRDPHDNVQVVRIDKPLAGEYTLAIFGSVVLFGPQAFALVATGDLQSALVSVP